MQDYLKISEFSKKSGISRKLLIYYDHKGILHPSYTDPSNGYRYYSLKQLQTANVITQLREAAVPLDTISSYLLERSPQRLLTILEEQEENLENQIHTLEQLRDTVRTRKQKLKQSLQTGSGAFTL